MHWSYFCNTVFNYSHFNYLHILIFYNKKDPKYYILYEFNVYTKTPRLNLRQTLTQINILDCNNT